MLCSTQTWSAGRVPSCRISTIPSLCPHRDPQTNSLFSTFQGNLLSSSQTSTKQVCLPPFADESERHFARLTSVSHRLAPVACWVRRVALCISQKMQLNRWLGGEFTSSYITDHDSRRIHLAKKLIQTCLAAFPFLLPRCSLIPVRARYPQKNRPPLTPSVAHFSSTAWTRKTSPQNTAAGSVAFIFCAHQRGLLKGGRGKRNRQQRFCMCCCGFRRIGRGIPAGRWNSQGVACKKSNQRGEKQQGSQQCVCLQGVRATTRQRMMKKPRVWKRKMFLLIHEPGHYRLTLVSAGTCLKLTQPLNPLATSPPHCISSQLFSRWPRSRSGESPISRRAAACSGFVWESSLLEATATRGLPFLLSWKNNERAQWTFSRGREDNGNESRRQSRWHFAVSFENLCAEFRKISAKTLQTRRSEMCAGQAFSMNK